MEVKKKKHGNVIILFLSGELDMYHSRSFRQELDTLDKSQPLVLDLGGLTYLDSSGVGEIIRLIQKYGARSDRMRVTGLTGNPREVLRMCNILTLLIQEVSVETAVKTLGGVRC